MASRFEIVDEEYIEELKDKSENKSTRKSTVYWKNVFINSANERNFQGNLEDYDSDILNQTLSQFYAELRKGNGDDHVFINWANERNFQGNLEDYESNILNQTLSQFYAELRKGNGDDYELDCLKVMQAHKPVQSPSSERESFLTSEKPWEGRPGNCESRTKESDQTNPKV